MNIALGTLNMANLKITLCFVLLAAVACVSSEEEARREHHLEDCSKYKDTDTLALRKSFEAKGKFLQIQKQTVRFPEFSNGDKKITCIRVTDLIENGKGGYPDILSGGVDFTSVMLQFTSQRSLGYQFAVEIYTV